MLMTQPVSDQRWSAPGLLGVECMKHKDNFWGNIYLSIILWNKMSEMDVGYSNAVGKPVKRLYSLVSNVKDCRLPLYQCHNI